MFLKLILIFKLCSYTWSLQCLDHAKNPVDWYVLYKLPLEKNGNPLITEGAAYTYMTSNDADGWKLANISINDTSSIVGVTLEPLFTQAASNLHILYNDEQPDGSINFRKGHTKGLVLGDGDGGIWLVHSVPRFPATDAGKYYFSHNGYQYGQSLLCISFDMVNLDKVGTQLQYNLPNIYSRSMPNNLRSLLPNLADVVDNKTVNSAPWYHLEMLKSKAGLRFFSFAKSPKFAKELYADWVAPSLNTGLLVETWPNEPGRIPSECGPHFNIYNVKSVFINAANFTFKTTTDHSKWAVMAKDNLLSKWICIGDINRAEPQRHRGGGTVCFNSGRVADTYQKSVADFEAC